MPEEYSDEVLLSALDHARGDDRGVILGALARSRGDAAPARLRQIVEPDSGEGGYAREAAIAALARRRGAAETLTFAQGLRDRSVYVQSAASQALAEYGDARATTEMVSWMKRKLRRKNRAATLDYEEVRAPVRFAARNGALREVARVLVESWDRLDQEERHWLVQAWPDLRQAASTDEEDILQPDQKLLNQPIHLGHRQPETPELEGRIDRLSNEYVQKALARANRRAQRHPNL